MCAEYIKMGDPPPTKGGQYEIEVTKKLREKLSNAFLVIGNPCFSTDSSFLYEYDLIICSPFICDVVEIKFLHPLVKVFEDGLECIDGFSLPNVFSTVENKGKVLAGRLKDKPFSVHNPIRVTSRVLYGPENTEVRFFFRPHERNNKFLKLSDLIAFYKRIEKGNVSHGVDRAEWRRIRGIWKELSQKTRENPKSRHKLGKFVIRKQLPSDSRAREYLGTDEAPCKVDVNLKEFPFDDLSSIKEIETRLRKTTRAMQIMRNLRHPYIRCVIGHFRTGCSLVQVSDWFEGIPLESLWNTLRKTPLVNKLEVMVKIAEALAFCHSKGVFHRNITASNILANEELDDLRICGFEYAKDVDLAETLSKGRMAQRDNRLITPEELLGRGTRNINFRLSDIYQVGILFYRIFENGIWPFEDPLDYCTSEIRMNAYHSHESEDGFEEVVKLISSMMETNPKDRPDPMQEVVYILTDIIRKVE